MSALMVKELELIEQFRDVSLVCEVTPKSAKLGMLKINNDFMDCIRVSQKVDVKLVDLMVGVDQAENKDFRIDEQCVLRFRDRICIPDDVDMKKAILEERHKSKLSIHPGATKLYQDLKNLFWWMFTVENGKQPLILPKP